MRSRRSETKAEVYFAYEGRTVTDTCTTYRRYVTGQTHREERGSVSEVGMLHGGGKAVVE